MYIKVAPYEDVKAVIYDDWIYDRITDDYCPAKEDFELPESGYEALGGYIRNKIASLFMVHDGCLHYMVLKPHRKHARDLLEASLKKYKKPLRCEIPSLYPEVINFAKKGGFKEVRIEKESHLKNGKLYNIHVLVR